MIYFAAGLKRDLSSARVSGASVAFFVGGWISRRWTSLTTRTPRTGGRVSNVAFLEGGVERQAGNRREVVSPRYVVPLVLAVFAASARGLEAIIAGFFCSLLEEMPPGRVVCGVAYGVCVVLWVFGPQWGGLWCLQWPKTRRRRKQKRRVWRVNFLAVSLRCR